MADIAELIVALKLQDGVSSGLGRLNGQLKGLQGGLSQTARGIGQVGRGLDQALTRGAIAAGAALTGLVTTASSMEEAFIGVQKTVDETATVSFAQLRQELRGISSDTGTAFEVLSHIGEIGGALGIGIESLDEFIDVVNRLSVSTDLTAETAADALGHLGTVLQLSGEDFRDLADGLVALGNAGASTEGQIVEIANRFAVAGKRAGLTTAEILALSSAVASMGIEVEAGGTALSNTFNQIAVAIGTGGKEVEAFTRLLGVNAAEFRRRWEQDALGTFQEFLREVDKLPAIEQAVALEQAGITGARQQAAVGALADGYAELGRQLDVVENRQGALNEESDKFFASSAAGFRRLKENIRLSADTIGAELLPITNELIGEFITFLRLPTTQAGIKDFAKDLAGGIRSLVTEIKGADFGPLIDTMKGAAAIAKGAFDAFRGLPQPLQQLALAAIVANKVTGGAVGSIASGIGNIFAGLLKIKFLDRGSIANPMYVVPIGGGLGGGPTGPTGPAGRVGSAALGVAKFVLGPAAAVIIGSEIAAAINEQVIGPEREGEKEEVKAVLEGSNVRDMVTTLASIDSQLNTDDLLAQVGLIGSRIPFIQDALGHIAPTFEAQSRDLIAALEKEGLTRAQIDQLIQLAQDEPAKFESALQTALAPLVARERRANVAGGGFDPGTAFRDTRPDPRHAITQVSLSDTTLAPITSGLTDLNRTLSQAASSDAAMLQASRTQTDALTRVQTTTDLTRQVTQYLADQAVSSDAAMLQTARTQSVKLDTTNARLSAIENRDWSPTVNLTNNINLSPTVIQQKIVQTAILGGIAGGNTIR